MPSHPLSRRAVLALLAASAWPARAVDASPYDVLDFDWHDADRERRVPVRLYRPALASAARPVPT